MPQPDDTSKALAGPGSVSPGGSGPAALDLSHRASRRWGERLIALLLFACGLASVATTVGIVVVLVAFAAVDPVKPLRMGILLGPLQLPMAIDAIQAFMNALLKPVGIHVQRNIPPVALDLQTRTVMTLQAVFVVLSDGRAAYGHECTPEYDGTE